MALSVELHKKFKGFQMDVAFEHDGGSLGILGGSGMGKSMSRLGGGIGTRGPGETKLETDRRHIRQRIDKLRRSVGRL